MTLAHHFLSHGVEFPILLALISISHMIPRLFFFSPLRSKGKLREKKQHATVFNKALFDKFVSEVPKKSIITIFNLVENYKINCSLARKGIRELVKRNLITAVVPSGTYCVYTKSAAAAAAQEKAKAEKAAAAGAKDVKKPAAKGKAAKADE